MTIANVAELAQQTKTCCRCKEEKSLTRFSPRAKGSHLLRSYCKDCASGMTKKFRQVNPDHKANEGTRSRARRAKLKELGLQVNDSGKKQRDALRYDAIKAKRDKEPKSCKVFFLTCKQTGKPFASKKEYTQYSKEGLRLRAKLRPKPKTVRVPKTSKACKYCKGMFEGRKIDTYCSSQCKKASSLKQHYQVKNYKLRAKKYGCEFERIAVIAVFERDKWRCQLCGIRTPKSKRGTIELNAPELDHIIPMSKRGGHTYSNVQCTCRGCNGKKGSKTLGQLSLLT